MRTAFLTLLACLIGLGLGAAVSSEGAARGQAAAEAAGRAAVASAGTRIDVNGFRAPKGQSLHAVTSMLNVPRRLRYGEFVWSENGAKPGPVWIRIDLDKQLISVFRSGDEIGTAVILYGATEKETPRGSFPILSKDRDHRSSSYDAAMPYSLRLTGDGVAIHASGVRWGFATHGCIGVPVDFAKRLFAVTRKGDEVLIV